nr:hypothetical protein [Clostridium thailandense]
MKNTIQASINSGYNFSTTAKEVIENIELESLDLMYPISIDKFSERFLASNRPLHILVNSAGIMAPPLMKDFRGYESQFATNHLGHFQFIYDSKQY